MRYKIKNSIKYCTYSLLLLDIMVSYRKSLGPIKKYIFCTDSITVSYFVANVLKGLL